MPKSRRSSIPKRPSRPDYLDTNRPIPTRVADLISRMTVKEKVANLLHESVGVDRLGIPDYNWWSEGAHGVARAGKATVFPQVIGMAASFDETLIRAVAAAISDEARAKHHAALKRGHHGIYVGLTYWCPNINIFRDPRWGRGQETFGEDPCLTSRLGVAFVQGLQGDDPRYLKVVATPKHFAVHSGPEELRRAFDAKVDPIDLWQTYLPAFKSCVQEGKAASVMGAYNRFNGEPCCGSPALLQQILRDEWGFDGFVVSDCGAIYNIHEYHKVTATFAESSALAIRNGCEVHCGGSYPGMVEAVEKGLLAEADVDKALTRAFTARFRLGMFDPPEKVPYAGIPLAVVGSEKHRKIALQAARESIVLLKNRDCILPLDKKINSIHIVGPNAASVDALLGNYFGVNDRMVTIVEGVMSKADPGQRVMYEPGCLMTQTTQHPHGSVQAGKNSDVVIAVLGNTSMIEGEEGDAIASARNGDRTDIGMPRSQEDYLRALCNNGGRIVLVLTGGSATTLPEDILDKLDAVVQVWYPGQEGGTAVADVLFGDYNPGGRMPLTVYKSVDQLPPFEDYRMQGRTYRYFNGETQFPFGYGLSYTRFSYSGLSVTPRSAGPGDDVTVKVTVRNAGKVAGDEVVQIYLRHENASAPMPLRQLCGFKRIHLAPGTSKAVSFTIKPYQRSTVTSDGRRSVEPGQITVWAGGCQPGYDRIVKGTTEVVAGKFVAAGAVKEIDR